MSSTIRRPPAVEKLALSPNEAARSLGISERTLWSITSPRGPLRCVRIGSRPLVRYPITAIEQYLVEQSAVEAGEGA